MKLPVDIPMVPSGGFYSSASELARWVQWYLNEGKIKGKALISAELFKQMTAIPNQLPGQNNGYGLGTGIRMNHGSLRFGHGGGGFGFISAMNWYPEWNLGALLLTKYFEKYLYFGGKKEEEVKNLLKTLKNLHEPDFRMSS